MSPREESFSQRLLRLFFIAFGLIFGGLFVAVLLANRRYELTPVKSVFLWLFFSALLAGVYYLLSKSRNFWQRHGMKACVLFIAATGAAQLLIAWQMRYNPLYDIDAIYSGGLYWAQNGSISGSDVYLAYMHRFPNNLGAAFLFRCVFGLTEFLGINDHFMVACFLNTAMLQLCVLLVFLTARRLFGAHTGVWLLFVQGIFLPFYLMGGVFYTDTLSAPFPILAVYIILCCREVESYKNRVMLYGAAGLALGVGALIKTSVAIALAAVLISLLFPYPGQGKRRALRDIIFPMAAVCAAFALCIASFNIFVKDKALDKERLSQSSYPLTHWVAMGLQGYGSYNNDEEAYTASFPDYESKRQANMETIKERLGEAGPVGIARLLLRKGIACFGDGTFELYIFLDDNPFKHTVFHSMVIPGWPYYKQYQGLAQGLYLAVFFMAVAAAAAGGLGKNAGKAQRSFPLPWICLFGLLMFLLIWETSSRYTLNYFPLMLVCAGAGISQLEFIGSAFKKRSQAK